MSEKDQKDLPKADDTPDEGDIDNLSQTEKAAFEKIMAQISEADDAASSSTAESPETEPVGDPDVVDAPGKDHDAASTETTDDAAVSDEEEPDDDDLSDDQRQALDAIMAEIAGEDDKADEIPVDDGGDDQQATLNEVMAEIETKETDSTDPADPADEKTLSDDQQAALDQIMAEIKGDEEHGPQTDEDSSPIPTDDEQGADADKPVPGSGKKLETDGTDKAPSNDEVSDGLSLEEFDDELSSLLNPSTSEAPLEKKDATGESSQTPPPASPDQSLEDINSALKNIVKTSDKKDNNSTSSSEADSSREKKAPPPVVLKEVNEEPTPQKRGPGIKSKKALWSGAIAAMATLLGIGGYWGYHQFSKPDMEAPIITVAPEPPAELVAAVSEKQITLQPPLEAPPEAVPEGPVTAQPEPFDALKSDIIATRKYIQQKKEELLELKHYYQNGIQQERNKLLNHQTQPPQTFKAALESRHIELGLRSIQRRVAYNLKLDTPLAQVETHLEQLLYLERRLRLFELLNNTISGLSLADLKRDGTDLISRLRKESEQLSVENVESALPSLKSIWQEISMGDKSGQRVDTAIPRSTPQNQKISKDICKGNFERKYQLTALTPQTAKCLANWPGKDLYLNGLTHLSPTVAKQLAQWPGEWLSLNGIKRLSPESARHLSKWKGKRLSLNGVSILSDEATTYLAQWQGEQLEMIGLTAIGRWENYVTHLFLSERLRRKLQVK